MMEWMSSKECCVRNNSKSICIRLTADIYIYIFFSLPHHLQINSAEHPTFRALCVSVGENRADHESDLLMKVSDSSL